MPKMVLPRMAGGEDRQQKKKGEEADESREAKPEKERRVKGEGGRKREE